MKLKPKETAAAQCAATYRRVVTECRPQQISGLLG